MIRVPQFKDRNIHMSQGISLKNMKPTQSLMLIIYCIHNIVIINET